MPVTKICPKCGTRCILQKTGIVFGYECENCEYTFDVWKIVLEIKE